MLCRNPNSCGSRWDWDQFLAQRMLLITLSSVCARGPGLGIKTSQKVSQTYHGPGQGLCMDGREEGVLSGESWDIGEPEKSGISVIHGMPPGTIIQGSGQTLLQGHQTRMAPKSPHILVSQGIGETAKPPSSWDDQKEALTLHLAPKRNGTFHEASQE